MKSEIVSIEGKKTKEISLPSQFNEPLRPDLIKRAVLAIHSHNRQPYGSYFDAGTRNPAKTSKRRRDYKTSYGYGISRVPRKIMSRSGTRFNWIGAFAPHTRGGRRAHPPKVERDWSQKINTKERRKAIRSALSATTHKEIVKKRGHNVVEYPLVVEDRLEEFEKTKDVIDFMEKNGLKNELERIQVKKIRAGRGKSRGRKYKLKVGPLFVVSKECNLLNSGRNIPGVDVEIVTNLNAELLAPGTDYARLTIYTEGAILRLEKERLFTDSPVHEKRMEEKPAAKKQVKPMVAGKPKETAKKESQTKKSVKEASIKRKEEPVEKIEEKDSTKIEPKAQKIKKEETKKKQNKAEDKK